ncbi:MAG TPA: outer-membrane lipoprotein carrier protein LolA [Terriglobales bacterium]|nr:outer-membrane lipoprotein carrier protein LolA [Terriglobales bacterium]
MNLAPIFECFEMNWAFAIIISLVFASPQASPQASPEPQHILSQMDQTAANFRTTQAVFVWDQYQKVVDEHDIQKGIVYFRRVGNEIQMAADIQDPASPKYVLFTNSTVEVYQPRIDQVTRYSTGKDRATVEGFLVLGFGGSGKDMLKAFEVKYVDSETLNGVDTVKLDLVPKSEKGRNMFDHIWLWVDTARRVSVQQQLFEPSGDYRLAKYSDIQLNQKIPDAAFKLKTTSKTKVVSPQG